MNNIYNKARNTLFISKINNKAQTIAFILLFVGLLIISGCDYSRTDNIEVETETYVFSTAITDEVVAEKNQIYLICHVELTNKEADTIKVSYEDLILIMKNGSSYYYNQKATELWHDNNKGKDIWIKTEVAYEDSIKGSLVFSIPGDEFPDRVEYRPEKAGIFSFLSNLF